MRDRNLGRIQILWEDKILWEYVCVRESILFFRGRRLFEACSGVGNGELGCLGIQKISVGEKVKPFLRKILGLARSVLGRFEIREGGFRIKSEVFEYN